MSNSDLFTAEQQEQIVQAIREAEKNTSGEVRVHIDRDKDVDPLARAQQFFDELGMDQTHLRNAVLVYLAVNDQKFTILGDIGIHRKVGDSFWEETRNLMQGHFRQGNFTEGLTAGILQSRREAEAAFSVCR